MVPTYSGYSVYAELKVGSNGSDEGIAEVAAGDAAGNAGFGHTTWDDNVSDGVDSDWVRVSLVAGPSGVTWTVGESAPVHVADSIVGDIVALKVRAAVSGGDRQSSWRNLVASFYDSGNSDLSHPSEQLTLGYSMNPVASTIGASPNAESDRSSDIWPDGSGYKMVRLTASVRMQSLGAFLPSPNAVFGQVYLYASAPPVTSAPQTAVYVAVTEPQQSTTEPNIVTITNFTDLLSPEELALLG